MKINSKYIKRLSCEIRRRSLFLQDNYLNQRFELRIWRFKPSSLTQRLRLLSQLRFLLAFSFFLLTSCGEWGWQSVDYDYDSQLNVFGMIMLGDDYESYVIVQQSLPLVGSDTEIAGYDTIYYGPDSTLDIAVTVLYKSAYAVDDAVVYLTNGNDTSFFYLPDIGDDSYNYYHLHSAVYEDTLNAFNPQPNTTYSLHVSTPDGRVVTGELTTPDFPHIYSDQVPDTVYNKHQYTIPFKPMNNEEHYLRIQTGPTGAYCSDCGMRQLDFIDYGDSTWTSSIENCADIWWCEVEDIYKDSIRIELQAMDKNYYNYFIKNSESAEYVNFFMGVDGSSGKGFGVEGGMGVFGAKAIDAIERVYVPW